MGRSVVLGQAASPAASAGYLGYWPCLQANTDTTVKDRSGKGNDLVFNSLTTGEAWTTASRLSKPTTASHAASLAKATLAAGWKWNASRRDSLLISLRAKITLTGGSQNWMGNANSATEGGMKWLVSAAGAWQVAFYDQPAAGSVFGTSIVVDASWGSNDHTCALLLDGPNNTYSMYVDGALVAGPSTLSGVTNLDGSAGTFDFGFGTNQVAGTGTAMSMLAMHMLAAPMSTGSPRKPDELARRLHRSPFLPVSKSEWPY